MMPDMMQDVESLCCVPLNTIIILGVQRNATGIFEGETDDVRHNTAMEKVPVSDERRVLKVFHSNPRTLGLGPSQYTVRY